MKVLFLTQVVDPSSDLLGFVPSWIRALSRRVETLYVLAGRVRPCDLPANVEVASLGKETGRGRLARLARFYLGLRHAVNGGADLIFAHMNPEYVLAAAPVSPVPVVLWYTHTAVTARLKLAARLARRIVTATPGSCRLPSRKVRVVGHGIDLSLFPPSPPPGSARILTVGRLDAVKDVETLIEGIALLRRTEPAARLVVAGDGPLRGKLEALARERGVPAQFLGSVPYPEIPRLYRECDLFVSASRGALDKVILEAMASGRPAVACSEAAHGVVDAPFRFAPGDA
ncbi:MAG: glycosyltransferase, partial [Candidatus Brocadiae bacterium]|nr:glycosyltransferase [Candidatus Brocadiia bacterium]